MRNHDKQNEKPSRPEEKAADLTPIFHLAGFSQKITASEAFEAKYQFRVRGTTAPNYELIWGVRLAIDGSLPARRLRARQGRALLLELPILDHQPPNEDAKIVIQLVGQDRLHLMLPDEFAEPLKKRVLVAENDDMIAAALNRTLCRAGFEVGVARTGAGVLELLQRENFDVALIDVDLQDIHGFALCSRILSNPLTQHLPLVICSAWPGAAEIAARVGAIGYLEKPQDLGNLPERLRGFMGASHSG